MLHWGGRVEGGLYPDINQPGIAKKLIDGGADMIVGHHSHTLQPYEIYKNKYIFYSIGNFCFEDYVFEGETHPMPLRRNISSVISVFFEKYKYKINFDFFLNKKISFKKIDYLPQLKRRNARYKLLFSNTYFWKMYFFSVRKVLPLAFFIKRKDLTIPQKIKRITRALRKRL